ncbi:MAG: AlpA family phage regulatory protein [Sedimenticola sp.]
MKNFSNLPNEALIRLPDVLTLIPVSRASWWEGVSAGRYPKPVKLSARVTAWRVGDIREFIANVSG